MIRRRNAEQRRRDLCDAAIALLAAEGARGLTHLRVDRHAGFANSLLSTLAEQAMRTAVEPERSRARARFELMMIASRDPDLGLVFDGLMDRFVAISEAAVAQVQPADKPPDRELIKEQAFAVVTFLGGFLFRLAYGLTTMDSAESLEKYLHSVIAGVAADHVRIGDAR
jgi:hypothetical protein